MKRYVKVTDADGHEIAVIETPAYPTTTVVYSSPRLQKGSSYTLFTGDDTDSMYQLTTILAQ